MSADQTPAPRASNDPGRRDGRPLPPPRPAPRPYAGRPERSAWRTLGMVVVGVLAVCGLMAIAFMVLFVVSLNSWASNK